jgi:hypothetical protein
VGKKKDDDLSDKVDELIKNVGEDRERLTSFLDDLISNYSGETAVGIAEYVAKLADALTRQNQVKVGLIKALVKKPADAEKTEIDELHEEIGLPFNDEELDEGSN